MPTNEELTRALAHQVNRPAFFRVPSVVLRTAAGEMAPELLNSVNAYPAALLASGFTFRDPDVSAVIREGLTPLALTSDTRQAPPSQPEGHVAQRRAACSGAGARVPSDDDLAPGHPVEDAQGDPLAESSAARRTAKTCVSSRRTTSPRAA